MADMKKVYDNLIIKGDNYEPVLDRNCQGRWVGGQKKAQSIST